MAFIKVDVGWVNISRVISSLVRLMAHDPSSPPKFLVPETGHQKLVSKLRTPDTRNFRRFTSTAKTPQIQHYNVAINH